MVVVPAAKPVTMPELLIEATEVLELVQVPPLIASLRVVLVPVQILVEPVTGSGVEIIVTILLAEQPPPNE